MGDHHADVTVCNEGGAPTTDWPTEKAGCSEAELLEEETDVVGLV